MAYNFPVETQSQEKTERLIERIGVGGLRGARAGAGIGLVFGGLVAALFSPWLPEGTFEPVAIGIAAIFAIFCAVFLPDQFTYRELGDDPDCITPAERVRRLQCDRKNGSRIER